MMKTYIKPDTFLAKMRREPFMAASPEKETVSSDSHRYTPRIGSDVMDGNDMYAKGVSFGSIWDD